MTKAVSHDHNYILKLVRKGFFQNGSLYIFFRKVLWLVFVYDTVNKTFRTANVGVTGIVSDVDYYALTNELPKKLSELDNDVGYITENGVMMYDSFDKFPTSGNAANIYLAKDTNYTYRYDSILKTYIEVSRPYEELTEISTDIIVNGKLELIIGDVLGAKVPD